jgi:hypothetical protein
MHFFPEVDSFLLFNLWVAVADLYEKSEEERASILARLREDADETLSQFARWRRSSASDARQRGDRQDRLACGYLHDLLRIRHHGVRSGLCCREPSGIQL